jgi:hypothetical protein
MGCASMVGFVEAFTINPLAMPFVPLVVSLLLSREVESLLRRRSHVLDTPAPTLSFRRRMRQTLWRMRGTSSAVRPTMEHTYRVKKGGPRQLYFLVDRGADQQIATSDTFDTICKLEAGLAVLLEVAQFPESAVVERDAEVTSLSSAARRMRVRFRGHLDDDGVSELLRGVMTATLIDERPKGQRRADLSGRLRELGH